MQFLLCINILYGIHVKTENRSPKINALEQLWMVHISTIITNTYSFIICSWFDSYEFFSLIFYHFIFIIFRPFITTIRTNIGCAIKIGVVHVALRTVGNFTHNSIFKMSGKDRDITSYLLGIMRHSVNSF